MNELLKHIYNACDPIKPATAEYYFDCGEARGEGALSEQFLSHLNLANDYIRFLFSGHIGCGKSSELERLCEALKIPSPNRKRYFPILLNVSEYLDDYDSSFTDILLAIVTELAATLRDELNIELKDSYFTKRINEIREFLQSEVEVNEGELELGFMKAKIQRLRRDPDARKKVRLQLEPKMITMLEEINTVFDEARLAVKKHKVPKGGKPYSDFVLILDNLEKIRKIQGFKEGLESQRELFLERYTQLTSMRAHVIYTVPLRLARSAIGPQLEMRYGPLFVLPMIKVSERGTRHAFEQGLQCLRRLLQKRLGGHKVEEVFEKDALDFLLNYSGGHARNVMSFVQSACTYSEDLPITLSAIQRAVQQTVRIYSTAIPESHWEKLAELDRSTDQKIPNDDEDYLVMLENLSVLEYLNGGEKDIFSDAEPWYAVNPIVRELQKFKAAAIALSNEEKR